ncbi:alpha/beta fold hydrolase [Sphingomonas sp. SUN039]|uniref:alpha/beta fold hydrolase n=1 Tax=Sphingomonas sp. SUN039 TaxID=2937787 RepID=UPI0021646EEE|nr:alpha/beta hydrolase [Sphingomonas sp. SUN039]UVO55881.1 alpha/beta hydrolase [Sphingomonas sp. SUN039]
MRFLKWAVGLLLVAIIGLGFAYWTPDTDKAAMRAKYGSAASKYLNMGDAFVVHYRDEGPRDAPVIVLIHGSNSFLQTWDDWTRALTPTYRVIRLDLPGHGLTGDYRARSYNRSDYVDVIDAVTKKLRVSRFVLGGNSMGGGVAWAYAHQYPFKVTGLVLVDATGAPQPADAKLPLGFRLAGTPVARDLMAYITPRSLVADGLRGSFADPSKVTEAKIDRYWELLRYPGNRVATVYRFSAGRETAITTPLPHPIPTLIMWGAADKLIPVSSAAWFKAQLPDAQEIIYPNVGHLPMEEIPERSAADLKTWLAKLPKAQ